MSISKRHTHRSYVSYIDKSREFYAAHGYENPYAWATHRDVPFTALSKPLAESRVGVVTTADIGPRSDGRAVRQYVQRAEDSYQLHTDMSWDRQATHMDDAESFLPLDALARHQRAGHIGSLSPRFYGVSTEHSQRLTTEQDAPEIAAWMREDNVDVAVLVAI